MLYFNYLIELMKRSKGEVAAKILEICLNPACKTVIVYGSNLNFKTVNLYLESLTKNGHIEIVDEKALKYQITEKGKELLASIKVIQSFYSTLEEPE